MHLVPTFSRFPAASMPRLLARLLAALCLVAASAATGPAALAQSFDVDAMTVRGAPPARPRLDVFARVPYAALNFTNVATGFQARYTMSVDVFAVDARGRQRQFIVSRSWERVLPVGSYAQARSSDAADLTTQALDLTPGRYLLQFQLEDGSTRRTTTREVQVQVRDMAPAVALSDVALADRYDAATNAFTPRVTNQLGTGDENALVVYELYAPAPTRVRVVREIARAGADDAVVTTSATQTLRAGRNPFVAQMSLRDVGSGDYVIRVRLLTEAGLPMASAEKNVAVAWEGLAEHIRDIDGAVSQLRHIAKDRDLDYIRGAPSEAEKVSRFRAFWGRLDPTPGTERNERMEEYYYRVDFANRSFGAGRARSGWETDRGVVMIRFGEPENVERHPVPLGQRPYEVWYYPRIQRRFVFIDRSGFGDFQLIAPIWDDRNRM